MAVTCTRSDLAELGKCYTLNQFSELEQQAILVWRLASWADGVGGSTYATTMTTTLMTDAALVTGAIDFAQMNAALIGLMSDGFDSASVLNFAAGVSAGSSAGAVEAIKCLKGVDLKTLKSLQFYLACYLISRIAP